MKRFMLIISAILMLNFVACGSNSSKEAKELLQRILTLVGIPQEIVVNICQDDNDNGVCESFELQAKITINKGDSLQTILEKIRFEANGTYILQNYDPTKKILMELEDNQNLNSRVQPITLSYQPKTQELSILQSLVDNSLLQEEEIKKIRESDSRALVDEILLENLFQNQAILIKNNMTQEDATARNLEYIAEGLLDIDIADDLVEQLESCEDDSKCQRDILIDTDEQTEINEKEAVVIAETNSTEETGNRDTLLTDESNSTIPTEENNTTSQDSNTSSSDNNSSNDATPEPTPTQKTQKNVADGYIIKLSSPATASCQDGNSTFTSSQTVGAKGQILFDGVSLGSDCIITVPSGATLDSNNNGSFDSGDKLLLFDMRASADASYITPLTTLLLKKKENGEDVSAFEAMVKDFDPVASASAVASTSGVQQTKIQKLIVLMEILKTAMKDSANIADINLSSIINTSSGESIGTLDIGALVSGFPVNIQSRLTTKANNIKELVSILDKLDSSKICLQSFLVSVSDGEKNIPHAINEALKVSIPITSPATNPFEFIAKSGMGATLSATLSSINDSINLSNGIVPESDYFITTWKTDNNGTSANNQITIPTIGGGYNYFVDWGDGTTDNNVSGNITHTYASVGTYTVKIYGDLPRIYFNDYGQPSSDAQKLLSIEQWGTNSWTSMEGAFFGCSNMIGNTSDKPDLSNVTNMHQIFRGATNFNQDIGDWNTSTITNMREMFYEAKSFNQNIGSWNVANVTTMQSMFNQATNFNQNISSWDVSNVTNMSYMFNLAVAFNQDIGSWNIDNVTDIHGMFNQAITFNQNIGSWNVSNVTNMSFMFYRADVFNQDIGNWNVGNVTNMLNMFGGADAFNQDIGNWNVANVTTMSSMFGGADTFNQDIGNWNVSNVTNMEYMFGFTPFNQDISGWNVANVTNMNLMFSNAINFNQDISGWNVPNVTTMRSMFINTNFNQNIGSWDVSNVIDMSYMFHNTTLSTTNYDAILTGWSNQSLQNNVTFSGGNSKYSASVASDRQGIIDNFGWTITDGGQE